jgi:hypothetical protein
MTDDQLDTVYTTLCNTMTTVGEAQSTAFLARFALLSCIEIGDEAVLLRLIQDTVTGLLEADAESVPRLKA